MGEPTLYLSEGLGFIGGRCYSSFCYLKLRTRERWEEGRSEEVMVWNGEKKKIRWKTTAGAPKYVIEFHTTTLKSCRNCSRWIYKLHSSCSLMPAHSNATHKHENDWEAVAAQLQWKFNFTGSRLETSATARPDTTPAAAPHFTLCQHCGSGTRIWYPAITRLIKVATDKDSGQLMWLRK